jgi:hypothetical protein
LICVLLVFFFSPAALAQQELNNINLGLAAILMSDDFDRRAHAISRLVARDDQAWAQQDDEGLRLAALETELEKLQRELDSIDPEQPFLLSGSVRLKSYDLGRGGFPIASLLKSDSQTFASNRVAGQLPKHFTLLTANYGFADLWPVDRENAVAFLDSRTDATGKTRMNVYLELELRLASYTQDRFLHAAVMVATLYEDESRETMIFHAEENRSLDEIIEGSLLGEGISLDLPAINSFYVFGQRMLSPMRPNELADGNCREMDRIDDHRMFVCGESLPYAGTSIQMDRQFVGGVLVGLDFHAVDIPPAIRVDHLRFQFQRELGLSADAQFDLPHCWSFRGVSFRLDEYRLRAGDTSAPFLRARAVDFPPTLSDLDCAY